MLNHNSAVERDETPHTINSTQNNASKVNGCLAVAYRRRAESVIRDRSIDAETRAVIRYALETHDPWLAELLRRVDAGESLINTVDFSEEPQADYDDDSEAEKIEALAQMICRDGDDSATKSAALLVLMATLERSPHVKALANTAKHLAFTQCAEMNLCGMVDAEIGGSKPSCLAAKRSLRNRDSSGSRFPPPALFEYLETICQTRYSGADSLLARRQIVF